MAARPLQSSCGRSGGLLMGFTRLPTSKRRKSSTVAMPTAARAAQHVPIGSPIRWENPSSGNYGSITPRREGRHRRSGAVCREFSNSLTIDGQTEDFVGAACRARDGSWNFK